MKKNLKSSGITLVEVLVTLLLFTMIVGGLYANLLVGNMAWRNFESVVQVQQEARRALTSLTRDFRVAENVNIMPQDRVLTITFHHPQDGNISYFWAKTGPQAGELIRQSPALIRNVGRLISDLEVTLNGRVASIHLTTQTLSRQGREVSFSLGQEVYRRR